MKLGKNIIVIVPFNSVNHELTLPYNNLIKYEFKERDKHSLEWNQYSEYYFKKCKHLKPNSGIRYKIVGKWLCFLLIKIVN